MALGADQNHEDTHGPRTSVAQIGEDGRGRDRELRAGEDPAIEVLRKLRGPQGNASMNDRRVGAGEDTFVWHHR
jgi:hypothetical protein